MRSKVSADPHRRGPGVRRTAHQRTASALEYAFTRRERQIMDIVYRHGVATATEVMDEMPGGLDYSTVRTQLHVLEVKGHVSHVDRGRRYVYAPTIPRHVAGRAALEHLIDTYFGGRAERLVVTLLDEVASRRRRRIAENEGSATKTEEDAIPTDRLDLSSQVTSPRN
jgi:BlaI family transcriptional regulator, penicillinase repressor